MSSAAPQFIHLNVHSTFSLLEGLPSVKSIAKKAKELGMPAVGVADSNNLFAAVEMSKHLPAAGIQPIIGTTLGVRREDAEEGKLTPPDMLTLLVQDATGWQNLMQLSSKAFLESAPEEVPQVTWDQLKTYSAGLIALTGSARQGGVPRLLREEQPTAAEDMLKRLAGIFPDRLYVELQRHGMHEEKLVEADLVALAYGLNLPLVATNDCRFLEPNACCEYGLNLLRSRFN